MNALRRWLHQLLQWLNHWSKRTIEPTVIEEFHSDKATLSLLECDKPGVVDLWRITHRDAHKNLLCSLVYLPQLREDLGKLRASNRAAPGFIAWQRDLAASVPGALADADGVEATHLVLFVWSTRHPIRQVVKNKTRWVHCTELVACIFCDLEGYSRAWAPRNSKARAVVRALMRSLVEVKPPHPTWTWEQTLRTADWTIRLELMAKHFLGKDHVLQPPKRPEIRF